MEFRLLGPLEVLREGGPLRVGGPKQRALLALLLLHANEALSRERLIDGLWGERPPATAAKALQVYVSQLRKLLEPERPLETTASGYLFRLRSEERRVGKECKSRGSPYRYRKQRKKVEHSNL